MPFRQHMVGLTGTLLVEHYDRGHEGRGSHDLDSVNDGQVFRIDEGVDLQEDEQSASPGALPEAQTSTPNYLLTNTQAGEWVQYTIDVGATRVYRLEVTLASLGQGGRFHVEVDGVAVTLSLTVPDTGGWFSWQTLQQPGVCLSVGRHELRLVMDANAASGSVGNFDRLYLSTPPRQRLFLPILDN